ncbi:hypothetical protein [Vibrio rumoiensis]|uniref:Uncharacterized protein n=1 Tax=Vibrio rumoiensis 1S-45 TaxID=1188252 RepID=A0A1E5E1L2_9VIBR|nr:hypothetical protein [Vibrio rumoiensis]OEF25150.1 hypothetical protein A1QC_09605 [Vibrio rumoiensis 1S-45]
MIDQNIHPDTYFHIRVILGMVTSLAVARLLTGLARFVQHPGRIRVHWLHIGWVVFLFLEVLRFWWFEYTLSSIATWSFARYSFVTGYAALHFFLATMLFPDDMSEFDGYKGYMEARRGWFFGLVAALLTVDLIDTLLKGQVYYSHLALGFPLPEIILIIGSLGAMRITNKVYNISYIWVCLITQVLWILFRTGSM